MYDTPDQAIATLNHHDPALRLEALQAVYKFVNAGAVPIPARVSDVNNHIHTIYSFSPYSPTMAVYKAWEAGLRTAGIMDHDSIAGAREFIRAGEILNIATTIGIECRCDISHTPLHGRLLNNPDQGDMCYIAIHGIAHQHIETVDRFFAPLRHKREQRNTAMVGRVNQLLGRYDLELDYERDVALLSQRNAGGSVTERHICAALARRMLERTGGGDALIKLWKNTLDLPLYSKVEANLRDEANPYALYDLLGAIKSDLIGRFYIPASDELPRIEDLVALAHRVGGIAAYPYLGDVGESVTGDKKAQSFEDAFLPLLFDTIRDLGFDAVSYMPTRNTHAQLTRLKDFCRRYGFFEISGEDINTPRQAFRCDKYAQPAFSNLIRSTWALIGHERASSRDVGLGMFAPGVISRLPELEERIGYFERIGRL